MEFFGIRGHVEIEVPTKQFVCAFATEHHFDPHGADSARHKVHRGGGADGGHVVRFDVFDDVAEGIDAFLNGVGQAMVGGANALRHICGRSQIGTAFEADGETVHVGPPRLGGIVVVHTSVGMPHGQGGHHRGVEPT